MNVGLHFNKRERNVLLRSLKNQYQGYNRVLGVTLSNERFQNSDLTIYFSSASDMAALGEELTRFARDEATREVTGAEDDMETRHFFDVAEMAIERRHELWK